MKFKHLSFYFLAILYLAFAGCKKDSVILPEDMGYGYFPLNFNHTVFYEADSVQYYLDLNDSVKSRKIKFQIKDVISSSFYDNSNRLTFIFERFRRYNDTTAWQGMKTCTANKLSDAIHWKEDNYTYVNLSFPVKAEKHWNGNGFNVLGENEFIYSEVNIPYNYKGISTDSSLTVTQLDDINGLETNYKVEKYAKHIGLVYKEVIHHEKDLSNGDLRGGFEFRMKAIGFLN